MIRAVEHVPRERLVAGLADVTASPQDDGVLRLIVRRPEPGVREVLGTGELDTAVGLVGDNWLARGSRHTPDGSAILEMQLTLMNMRLARLVAGNETRIPLAGDQLYVDLDLSIDNLPAGSRLAIGDALLEVSEAPHLGCAKFVERFGGEAMRFVNSSEGRRMRLRGLHARVVSPGTVRVGDTVTRRQPEAR